MAEREPEVTELEEPGVDGRSAFGVTVRFDGAQAVLGVHGAVDLFGAPELGATLDAVISLGYRSVVLDPSLGVIDTSGRRELTNAASRLVIGRVVPLEIATARQRWSACPTPYWLPR